MKKNSICLVLLIVGCYCSKYAIAQQTTIAISNSGANDKISRHIYGHFAEHLGRCIYGGFYVGENNTKIPNVKGVRTDVVAALKKLKIPNLRWPGGCFAIGKTV